MWRLQFSKSHYKVQHLGILAVYISLHHIFHVQLGQELGVCRSLLVHYIKSLPIEGLTGETAERMGLRITGLTNVANQDHMQQQNM